MKLSNPPLNVGVFLMTHPCGERLLFKKTIKKVERHSIAAKTASS